MNQEKIRAEIMEQIELLPINDDGQTCTYFPDELADKILAAIAPHLKPGAGEQVQGFDRDEIYTEKFKEWREKYFTPDGAKRRFTSKSNGVLYDDFGLQEKFKRAYNLSPIK